MNSDIKSLFDFSNAKKILSGRIPSQLIIQYTNSCNATCPQCSMRKTEDFKRTKLDEEEIYKIIDSAAAQKIKALSFTGGEVFLYYEQLIQMIQYATKKNIPFIRTGTNGYMFMNSDNANYSDKIHRFAERLEKTNLRNLWISIDSSDPQTHEKMRGLNGVISGIEKAIPIFHQHGIYPAANLGVNRNTGGEGKISTVMTDENEFYEEFRSAFDHFYQFVIDLGFTMVNACYPMSNNNLEDSKTKAIYGASSKSDIVSFTKAERVQLFQALLDTIPLYRSKIRIFTPLVSLYSLIQQCKGNTNYAFPCKGGIDFFYIDSSDGNTYPCGFRGNENMGKFYDLDINSIKSKPFCKSCDWECFRDPSEMIGYLIESIHNPFGYITNNTKGKRYKDLWKKDISYYRACDFFDGRKPKNDAKLKKFV